MKKINIILNGKYFNKLFVITVLLGLTVGLTVLIGIGCGGGGDNVDTPIAPPVKEGIFLDSAVEGIAYSSTTQSGITDLQGTFKFQEGETITFAIGNIVLGQATAKTVMTPIDLVEGAVDPNNPTVTNICRFLQTLDNDNDPNNGLFIPEAVRNAAEEIFIDFDLTEDAFEIDPNIQQIVGSLTALTDAGLRDLVPIQDAREHLNITIITINNNAPIADAGPDQNVTVDSLVTLDGSGSSDADENELTFYWSFESKPDGSSATLSDSTAESLTFTADVAGTYVVSLTVNDGIVDSVPDMVTITAVTADLSFTGVFKGEETFTSDCTTSGVPYDCTVNGSYIVYLIQEGNSITGNLFSIDTSECCTATSTVPISGTITGATANINTPAMQLKCEKDNCTYDDGYQEAETDTLTLENNGTILRVHDDGEVFDLERQTEGDQIINVAGTWTWIEEQSEVISGSCAEIGEKESYNLTITQNGDQLSFSFNDVEGIIEVDITGTITGNIISASGTIQAEGGITMQDTIILAVSDDGQALTGILSQSSSNPGVCTGTFEIHAEKST